MSLFCVNILYKELTCPAMFKKLGRIRAQAFFSNIFWKLIRTFSFAIPSGQDASHFNVSLLSRHREPSYQLFCGSSRVWDLSGQLDPHFPGHLIYQGVQIAVWRQRGLHTMQCIAFTHFGSNSHPFPDGYLLFSSCIERRPCDDRIKSDGLQM